MAKTDRSIITDNDQEYGDTADPNKLETQIVGAYDTIDDNDDELIAHKISDDHDGRYYTEAETDSAINSALANAEGTDIIETGTSFPASPSEGQTFYRTDTDLLYIYTGGSWSNELTGLTEHAAENVTEFQITRVRSYMEV